MSDLADMAERLAEVDELARLRAENRRLRARVEADDQRITALRMELHNLKSMNAYGTAAWVQQQMPLNAQAGPTYCGGPSVLAPILGGLVPFAR
jgi:hypothetical protein